MATNYLKPPVCFIFQTLRQRDSSD